MDISVVIPTCNRKARLMSLLYNLTDSVYPLSEIIIVDSGEDRLSENDLLAFTDLNIIYLDSVKSVCIQRNKGISVAKTEWIFLCDDDIEVPKDYLAKLIKHARQNKSAGAISGLFLQKDEDEWQAKYSLTSTFVTVWRYIFHLSIWGEINCRSSIFTNSIKRHFRQKGNHISKAGWPVITNFSGIFFHTPVYSLGASLVKREWLITSPFDEVFDPHGIGENYGVTIDFPSGMHILNSAFVYHHKAGENRLQKSLSYYRRALALDYFRRKKPCIGYVKKYWFLWSLWGNLITFCLEGNMPMIRASVKLIRIIILNRNPYYLGALKGVKIVEPLM